MDNTNKQLEIQRAIQALVSAKQNYESISGTALGDDKDNKNISDYQATASEKDDAIELLTEFIERLPVNTNGKSEVLAKVETMLNYPKGHAYRSRQYRIGLFRSTLKAMICVYDEHEIRSVAKEAIQRDDEFEEYELRLASGVNTPVN